MRSRLIDPPEVADTRSIHTYRAKGRDGQGLMLSRLGCVVEACTPADDGAHEVWTKTVYRKRAKALAGYYRALRRLCLDSHARKGCRVIAGAGRMVAMCERETPGGPFLVEWINLTADAERAWLIGNPDAARARFERLARFVRQGRTDIEQAFPARPEAAGTTSNDQEERQ